MLRAARWATVVPHDPAPMTATSHARTPQAYDFPAHGRTLARLLPVKALPVKAFLGAGRVDCTHRLVADG